MKGSVLMLLLTLLAASASAQTHELLRKSVGGSVELPEPAGADFGLPSDWNVTVTHVDSLVYVGDGVAVKITKYYRKRSLRAAPLPRPVSRVVDTLYNHPLYSRQHALDSIRTALRKEQVEGLAETNYVGYDSLRAAPRPLSKKARRAERKAARLAQAKEGAVVLSIISGGNDTEPPAPAPLFIGGTALFALLLCGGIARLYRQAAPSS